MFEQVPFTEKSLKGMLKRMAKGLREFPLLFAVLHFPLRVLRRIKRFYKYSGLFGAADSAKFKISARRRARERSQKFDRDIKFSILVPLYNTPEKLLKQMMNSVLNQTYGNFQLCLADGSDSEHSYVGEYCKGVVSTDNRVCYKKLAKNEGISKNTNACIEMAQGDYIALFDHDDLLHPSALYEMMKAICEKDADFIYTDEVTFSKNRVSNITVYNFKPDFSPDTLRSYNYICHFTAFSKKLLDSVGYFNDEFDGSQDYDLILRLTENAKSIVHIPKVLYFWRAHKASVASDVSAKPYVIDSAKRAIKAHIERLGLEGTVEDAIVPTNYKVQYEIIGNPLISIIIPNKDHIDDLDKCLSSVYEKSTYKNFEVIIVENNSTEDETFGYYKNAESKYENLRVLYWKEGFNYSAINNFAARDAKGEYVLLLNNDMEIITPDWMQQMLMFCQRSDVGAVGAKLYYPDDTIQHAGVIVGLGGVAGHSHKYFDRAHPGYMSRAVIAQNLSACTAACLLVKKSVYLEVGGLDEKYAVAFNDIDFCMSIRKAGYLIVFTPFAELYHYESKSRGVEDTPEKRARFNSEVFRFQEKWMDELKSGDPYYNPNLTLNSEDFRLK